MTLAEQTELDAIRARQAYGIHRNSDYNREYELTATWRTKLGEILLLGAAIAFTVFKFGAIVAMIAGAF